MKSTDEKILRCFFAENLVPAAEALRARGVRFFPLGPEAETETWYVPVPEGEPDFFEIDEAALAEILHERWEAECFPELAALAMSLLELSGQLEVTEENMPDISPFVYVMY